MKSFYRFLSASLLGLFLFLGPLPVWAHDASVSLEIGSVGKVVNFQHEDQADWKGFLNLSVTNTGTEAWGDFHFQIFQVLGYPGSVVFNDAAPNQPTSSQSLLSWSLSGGGTILDLFFYADPVTAGETASFSVYTDNTANQVSFFGVAVYPTPVPIPAAAWLLGTGIVGLAALRRKLQK